MSAEDDQASVAALASSSGSRSSKPRRRSRRAMASTSSPGIAWASKKSHMETDHARFDNRPHMDRGLLRAIEAKPVGTTLAGGECQSAVQAFGILAAVPWLELVA